LRTAFEFNAESPQAPSGKNSESRRGPSLTVPGRAVQLPWESTGARRQKHLRASAPFCGTHHQPPIPGTSSFFSRWMWGKRLAFTPWSRPRSMEAESRPIFVICFYHDPACWEFMRLCGRNGDARKLEIYVSGVEESGSRPPRVSQAARFHRTLVGGPQIIVLAPVLRCTGVDLAWSASGCSPNGYSRAVRFDNQRNV